MPCSRCGAPEALIKKGSAAYCARCAMARDWEEVIAFAQQERVRVSREQERGRAAAS